MKRITVFCGANSGSRPDYLRACEALAGVLTSRNIGLVYGGGNVGLMGKIADEVLKRGGEVIGVIPQKLVDREVAHRGLTELRVVQTMHERKALMAELSDGFIALPGGIGTLEEIIEVFTWTQLGYHHKPCGLLNVAGYYDALNAFLEQMVAEKFLKTENRQVLLSEADPAELVYKMRTHPLVHTDKWIQTNYPQT
jgi:uncharacterized protein (TIGR00730 family)